VVNSLARTVPIVLKRRRIALGLTTSAMGQRLGCNHVAVLGFEKVGRKRGISVSTLDEYCKRGLRCPVADVIREAEAL